MGTKMAGEGQKSRGWFWWVLVTVIAVLVIVAVALTILKDFHSKAPKVHHSPVEQKYADALGIAMQFFDVQKSGKLVNNRISWRGDSGLMDGSKEGLDLSKGMYDAGDSMKFSFPMAFTATMLSWAILEYGDQMDAVKQLRNAQDSLKWITDYLINAHPSPNVLYIQMIFHENQADDEMVISICR